jgi:hypothetical protein
LIYFITSIGGFDNIEKNRIQKKAQHGSIENVAGSV